MQTERTPATRAVSWEAATQSGEIDLAFYAAAGIYLDDDFAGATLNVQVNVADDGAEASWKDLYDDAGNQVSLTVAAGRVVALPIAVFGFRRIRLVSDQSETAAGKLFAMS